MAMTARKVLAAATIAAALAGLSTHGDLWRLPGRYNPWAPLSYVETPNLLTRHKLSRLRSEPESCRAFLAAVPWTMANVPDRMTGGGCSIENAVRIDRMSIGSGDPFTLTCGAAASLALWERHVLQPEARAWLGSEVRQLRHLGSYACRNVYGREQGRRSQHATADALDIAGFILRDGRQISVLRGWQAGTEAERNFLRAVHRGACTVFDSVLGPDFNQAHADHFHFDRGAFRVCR